MSCAGSSEWSQIEQLSGTSASDWEGVPVPEVEEGDETEPCPVVLGTPVLSELENLHHGMVRLDWQDIEDAGWYVVQYYHLEGGEWLDLPTVGVGVAFHGSSAVVGNLDYGLSWLRVGAASCAGSSEWSQIEQLSGTSASDWEGVPVPEVEEGDETEPCSEDADTPANSPATGALTIGGTAQVGETLTAYTWGIADADGLTNATFSYQWLADGADIAGATGFTYTLADGDEGKVMKVRVTFTDDAGNEESLTSAATAAVAAKPNSPATGAPTIDGTVQVGETLTANTSGIIDQDGLSNASYTYQWVRNDGTEDADITGTTSSTYTLVDADQGKTIKVRVRFTDDAGNDETLTSAATAAVAAKPNSPATGAPTIDGTVQVGETLTANTSGIIDQDGLSNASYTYQWVRNDGTEDADITGTTSSTYTLVDADQGKTIKVRVRFTDDAGNDETLTSAATAAVAAKPNSPATGAPTIDGTVQVGETLTANTSGIIDQDGLSNASYTYQWVRNDGTEDADITGTTSSTYTLVDADQGKTITVRVRFTDDAGNDETLTSEPTGEVSEDYLLPDLVSDPPTRSGRVSVEVAPDGTELLALRFEGYVTNLGGGPLDLSGNPQLSDPADPTSHDVWQRALTTSGDWVQLTKPPVRYETADTHNHFHLMGVMAYSLWDETGTLHIRPSEKVGFCLVDSEHLPERHSQPSVQRYEQSELRTCMVNNPDTQSLRMGVSAGWRDIYHRDMVFQWVDVSDVTPGVYRIGVQADPNDVVVESDETNNGVALSEMVSSVPGYVAESQVVKAKRGETVDIELTFRRYGSPDRRAHRVITAASNGTLTTEDNFRVTDSSGMEHSAFYSKNVQYTPQADFVGVDTFTFIAFDSRRPDYPINPTVATVTIDMSGLDAGNEETLTSAATEEESLSRADVAAWSAIMTVERIHQGYGYYSTDAKKAGSLSPASFNVDGTTYTVKMAETWGWMYIGVDRELPFDFVLELDGVRFASKDASFASYTYSNIYEWARTGLRWRDGDTVAVRLLRALEDETAVNSAATGEPTIAGTAQVGKTLTANTAGIADADGLENAIFSYQWLADDAEIAGATNATYTLVDADEGKAITVRVSFTDDADNEETLTSGATDAVVGAQPTAPPDKPRGLEATATHDSVTLTWDDPDDDTITGYVILRRIPGVDTQGHFDELVANTGTAATTYTDDTVSANTRYTYRIKAINEYEVSDRSRWYHINTPAAPVPDKPTGLEATATHDSVTLTWDDPDDDTITGYVILRRVRVNNTGGDFSVLVADTSTAATTYTDNTVAAGTTYTYRIKAINQYGASERSRWYHIDTPHTR